MSGTIHNAKGRTSLARQGDCADPCVKRGNKRVDGGSSRKHESVLLRAGNSSFSLDAKCIVSGVPNRTNRVGVAQQDRFLRSPMEGRVVTAQPGDDIVAPATPSPIQAGAIVPRRRFQKGNIIIRGKTSQRYGMYREDVLLSNGTFKRVRRCVLLGPVSSLSERAAWKRFQPYLDRVNAAANMPPKSGITLEAFVKEWRTNVAVNLKGSTTRAAESHLRAHILPKLGSLTLTEINTKTVQSFVARLATGRSRKTVENVLLTLSSILRIARAWEYACGNFSLADITMPREGVRKEQRSFTDAEVGKILSAASEPFGTILAVTAVLGLRIGEVLALRVSDVDLARRIVRVRQSVDAATRTVQAVKSMASSADVPMPSQLEARLRKHLQTHDGKADLLFVNRTWPSALSQQAAGKSSAPAS